MPEPALLSIRGVSKRFGRGPEAVQALGEVSFDVARGAFVSILGPSGCGKSTLFNIIAGLTRPTTGRVLLSDQDVDGRAGQVGYMLQRDLLLPWRSIMDNITLPATLHGTPRREAQRLAQPFIDHCGLHGFEQSRPCQLSGGMRQRAALLRTLLTGRELLLLDEPFGALDAITRLQLQMTLTQVWQETHRTILFVTHDVEEALLLSDEIIVLSERPGCLRARVKVDLPRPRGPEALSSCGLMALKEHLMALLLGDSGEKEASTP